MLAQQSVTPSIPKSGLTTRCKDCDILDWGLDHDSRPHVLLDSSENDVIAGERSRDKEILLRSDCFSHALHHVLCRSCYCQNLNLTQSQCHKQHKLLGGRNTHISSKKRALFDFTLGLQCRPLTKVDNDPPSK